MDNEELYEWVVGRLRELEDRFTERVRELEDELSALSNRASTSLHSAVGFEFDIEDDFDEDGSEY